MHIRRLLSAFILLGLGQATAAYAGCVAETVCVKNPPFAPAPPDCTTYPNYCSYVGPQVQLFLQEKIPQLFLQEKIPEGQTVPVPEYSITLNNLSKDQLDMVHRALGIDPSKMQAPQ